MPSFVNLNKISTMSEHHCDIQWIAAAKQKPSELSTLVRKVKIVLIKTCWRTFLEVSEKSKHNICKTTRSRCFSKESLNYWCKIRVEHRSLFQRVRSDVGWVSSTSVAGRRTGRWSVQPHSLGEAADLATVPVFVGPVIAHCPASDCLHRDKATRSRPDLVLCPYCNLKSTWRPTLCSLPSSISTAQKFAWSIE